MLSPGLTSCCDIHRSCVPEITGIVPQAALLGGGGVLFASIQGASLKAVVTSLCLEILPFLMSLETYLATFARVRYAPALTRLFPFLMMLVVVVQISTFMRDHEISDFGGVLLLGALAFVSASYEVWMTTTNIQWWVMFPRCC